MTKKQIRLLAAATLVVMGGLGLIFIPQARNMSLINYLKGPTAIWIQVLLGTAIGWLIALTAWQIVSLPYLNDTRAFFSNLFRPYRLTWIDILFISFCAGVGEELLFRGVIQAYLGISWTAIIFVFLHGYLNPFNRPLSLYGLFMVLAIAIIGYMAERIGIMAACIAHFWVDVFLLTKLTKS